MQINTEKYTERSLPTYPHSPNALCILTYALVFPVLPFSFCPICPSLRVPSGLMHILAAVSYLLLILKPYTSPWIFD